MFELHILDVDNEGPPKDPMVYDINPYDRTPRGIFLSALEVLWQNAWSPGSISWRVFNPVTGQWLNVGENY